MTEGFFEPGATYVENAPFRAPELLPMFQCTAVADHPDKNADGQSIMKVAFGFVRSGYGAPWGPSALTAEGDYGWDFWVQVPASGVERWTGDSGKQAG